MESSETAKIFSGELLFPQIENVGAAEIGDGTIK